MGNGIAQVAVQSGCSVLMVDIAAPALEKGIATVSGSLDRLIKKELLKPANKTAILGRIETSTRTSDFSKCDIVIEAVTENIDLKLKLFMELDQVCSKDAILCSNTSSISITRIAGVTKRP